MRSRKYWTALSKNALRFLAVRHDLVILDLSLDLCLLIGYFLPHRPDDEVREVPVIALLALYEVDNILLERVRRSDVYLIRRCQFLGRYVLPLVIHISPSYLIIIVNTPIKCGRLCDTRSYIYPLVYHMSDDNSGDVSPRAPYFDGPDQGRA